jgi:isoleucyl-tRNA synthetase
MFVAECWQISAPIAPFFMDKLYTDLVNATGSERFTSVHLANFPVSVENFDLLKAKMMKAQTVSSLVLSLEKRKK